MFVFGVILNLFQDPPEHTKLLIYGLPRRFTTRNDVEKGL